MRNEWVRERLEEWARWVEERVALSRGYPTQTAFSLLRVDRSEAAAGPKVEDKRAERTHEAVESLKFTKPTAYRAICCKWVGDPFARGRLPALPGNTGKTRRARAGPRYPMAMAEIAALMGVTRRTVEIYLADAEALLGTALRRSDPPADAKRVLPPSQIW